MKLTNLVSWFWALPIYFFPNLFFFYWVWRKYRMWKVDWDEITNSKNCEFLGMKIHFKTVLYTCEVIKAIFGIAFRPIWKLILYSLIPIYFFFQNLQFLDYLYTLYSLEELPVVSDEKFLLKNTHFSPTKMYS